MQVQFLLVNGGNGTGIAFPCLGEDTRHHHLAELVVISHHDIPLQGGGARRYRFHDGLHADIREFQVTGIGRDFHREMTLVVRNGGHPAVADADRYADHRFAGIVAHISGDRTVTVI